MRIKLSYKIFVAFFLTSIMVVALMVGIMRFYVSRNFSDYVNNAALDGMNDIRSELAAEYQKHNGWQALIGNIRRWKQIVAANRPWKDFKKRMPPPRRPDFRGKTNKTHNRSYPKLKPPKYLPKLSRGLVVFDQDKQHIVGGLAGSSINSYTLKEISVDGRTVGWLGLHKLEHLSNPLVAGFLKQQSQTFYLIAGPILLLAAIVAFFLSKHLLSPIKRLTAGTRALASRQFDARIEVQSKDELGQLAADFNTMAQTLEKYEKMRQQWISDISHELRTPLAILRGEIEALQDGVRPVNSKALDSLQSEVIQLNKLVDDLHMLTLADSRDLNIKKEPVKPLQILREVIALFRTRLEQEEIDVEFELDVDEDIVLTGDTDHLTRLFLNLTENTLRYTDSPGKLKIFSRASNDTLTIRFEDSAPGVPQESLKYLFDRLYRVDKSRSRELGGSGLGMSICKQIVEIHGGKIQAANGSLGGLTITIELPLDGKKQNSVGE